MLNDYLDSYFDKFKASVWRKKVLHKEDIDLTLKHGLPVLKKLYEKYSGRYAAPGAAKYMQMQEF